MTRVAIVVLALSCAAAIAGRAILSAQPSVVAQQNDPGKPTLAKVYILNRGQADAVPVTLHGVAAAPIQVAITGIPAMTLTSSATLDVRSFRQSWEYQQLIVSAGEDPTARLNSAGAEGWEATGAALSLPNGTTRVILKRPR